MKDNKEINFIDLFAGASGLGEGFIRAGYHPIAHVELDNDACYTIKTRMAYHYLKNNSNLLMYWNYLSGEISRDDFYQLVPKKVLNSVLNVEISDKNINSIFSNIYSLLNNKEVDIIVGGPPCQAYSLIGRHSIDIEKDPRSKLYIQYGKFLAEFNPKCFVFENVPGILNACNGKLFESVKEYFSKLGYHTYSKILDSSEYGVLQQRKRVILIGWLKKNDRGFPPVKTLLLKNKIFDVLSDLPKLNPGDCLEVCNYTKATNAYLGNSEIRLKETPFTTQHICRAHNKRDLEIYSIVQKEWSKNRRRIKYTDLPDHLQTHNNITSFLDRYKVVDGLGFSHTVVAHIAKDGHYYIHPNQCRSLSVREAARIQSFPDDFYFEGSRTSAFRQIGNAVPPVLAYKIAKSIRKYLL